MNPQRSENDDTEGIQTEDVMQNNQSGNFFTENKILHFNKFDKQGNSLLVPLRQERKGIQNPPVLQNQQVILQHDQEW